MLNKSISISQWNTTVRCTFPEMLLECFASKCEVLFVKQTQACYYTLEFLETTEGWKLV